MTDPSAVGLRSSAWRRVGRVLAVAGLVAIAGATLTPSDEPHGKSLRTSLFCLVCGDQGIADVTANLLLFLPFATGLRLAGWSWLRTVAAAALVSFSVELLQFLVVTGREASLSDLLTNTLSGAMGAALGGAAVLLGQRRRMVVFDVPARALRYRLFPPSVSLADGLPAEGGTAATLRATERGRDLVLSSSYGGYTRTVALGITPAYGWSLISPFQFPGGTARWMTALFLALLYFPAGYWAASTGQPATAAAAVASGIGLALVALSPLAGLSPAPWSEWLGSLAGASLGWALRRAAAYLEERCASPSVIEFSSS